MQNILLVNSRFDPYTDLTNFGNFHLSNFTIFMFFFVEVTLGYKALLLLLNKTDDEDFFLGGKDYESECCAFYDAIRVNKVVFRTYKILIVLYTVCSCSGLRLE